MSLLSTTDAALLELRRSSIAQQKRLDQLAAQHRILVQEHHRLQQRFDVLHEVFWDSEIPSRRRKTECSRKAADVSTIFELDGVVAKVGHGIGPRGAANLARVSTSIGPCIRSQLPTLTAEYPALVYVVGGTGVEGTTATVECFDFNRSSWETIESMPTSRLGSVAVGLGGQLYVMGGLAHHNGQGVLLDVMECFNPCSKAWSSLAPMTTPRGDFAGAAVAGCIYVSGGQGRAWPSDCGLTYQELDSTEYFDPSFGMWFPAPKLATPRASCRGLSMLGEFCVVGGFDRVMRNVIVVESLCSGTTKWKKWPPVQDCLSQMCVAAVVDNVLHVLASSRGLLRFNPCHGHWEKVRCTRFERAPSSIAVVGSALLVFGGRAVDGWTDWDGSADCVIDQLEFDTCAWKKTATASASPCSRLPTSRRYFAVATVWH